MELITWLGACGLLSGFLAGLLGIGGGFVVVPAMYLLLPAELAPSALLPKMAVATSLAAMIPTTLAALLAQWRRGAVDARWLARMAPGLGAGAIAGALLMPLLNPVWVALVFVVYAGYFALRLLLAARGRRLPSPWNAWPVLPVATLIGAVSVLAGVGGAVFTVPFLESRAVAMPRAVATSSGVGLLLALVSVGSLLADATWQRGGIAAAPALIWWPAAVLIGLGAMLSAPLGVRMAHRLPVARLKQAFATLLVLASLSALWKVAVLQA